MGIDDFCHTGLVLGLSLSSSPSPRESKSKKPSTAPNNGRISHEPSLTLGLSGSETFGHEVHRRRHQPSGGDRLCGQDHSASGATSSSLVSNNVISVKRERETEEVVERERVITSSSRTGDEDEDGGSNGKKKLRLTKAQSALLEESFKHHSTLNPKQKQELARELKLRPRQVEVWFQNRRARTKLKQTEVDCELLKKCCDTLTDENRRLQKELHELKALKLAKPLYMAAALTMCPSCERIAGSGPDKAAAQAAFTMAPKPHLYNPFANQSAAC